MGQVVGGGLLDRLLSVAHLLAALRNSHGAAKVGHIVNRGRKALRLNG